MDVYDFPLKQAIIDNVVKRPWKGIAKGIIGNDYRPEGASRRECKELRLACLHKEELGEEGYGNCRRYRETCKE